LRNSVAPVNVQWSDKPHFFIRLIVLSSWAFVLMYDKCIAGLCSWSNH